MPAPDTPAGDKAKPSSLADALDSMAAAVRRLHAGEQTGALAALRRLDADTPLAPDFHALLAEAAPDHLFAGGSNLDEMTRRFARVAQIMALKPEALGGRPLGRVLQAIGFPKTRLAMLLNAQGPTLDDLARRAARRIALSDEPMPYRDLARLLLETDRRHADALRLRIARDYQREARAGDAEPTSDKKS